MASQLIFVTGASGFLGSNVVLQLLENGYRVRASARENKVEQLKSTYSGYGDRFEVVKIADMINDQFPDALQGVDALIHMASPLAGRAEPEALLKSAIEGTLNVIRQAEKAGVKRFVVTSSIATIMNPDQSYTDQDWNPVTKEMALANDADEMTSYSASKKFAELALWEWAEEHPHADVTTINPTFFFGPFTPYFTIPKQDFGALSTDVIIYNLLFPDGFFLPIATWYNDVRDVARAHVRALKSPPTSQVGGRKRIPFSSPYGWPVQKIVDFIKDKRPELKDRLIKTLPEPLPFDAVPIDFARIEQVLGMKVSDFHTIEETILETVDTLLKLEEQWKHAGFTIKAPPRL